MENVYSLPGKKALVIGAALEKVRGESMVRKLIQNGMPTRQVWDEYGMM